MAIFKCKMCGGTIEFNPGDSIGICDSCGTKQTLPRLDDDRRANLYDRANHFRRNNEFDKAVGIYEQILNEDTSDAEAYWSLVLCRYGIEYVEDPSTHKRVPTVNRTQFTSIFDDEDYKSALQHADGYQREIYESEANAINEIQKGILAISLKEDPFDIFICYKETDASGRRTQDSVLANDLYHQLTNEGFKVFFSRITLEDKLGTAYEPYIFAALNSAKVMVVLGTKPEHFNAVWVKNEWSRYLSLVKQSGGKKVLIPAYRDMDPYDLPEEFSHLQAQDMSKLGFMQDLIRGIKKIAKADEPKQTPEEKVVIGGNVNVAPLLKRAFMFLEDGNWSEADSYCEKVLDQEPENAQAYLGKLMAELHVKRQEDLPNCEQPFNNSNNYQKAVRFGDDKFTGVLRGYIDHINERNENARLTGIYNNAVTAMKAAKNESTYRVAAAKFKEIPGFKDADSLAEQCLESAEICRKDAVYDSARSKMTGNDVSGYETAIEWFSTITGWKDADDQLYSCQRKIEELKAKEEAVRLERERQAEQARIATEKFKRIIAITLTTVVACIVFVIVLITVIIPMQKLNKAMSLLDSGDYDAAYALLADIGKSDVIDSNKYDRAMALIDSGDYDTAYVLLADIGKSDVIDSNKNERAMALIDSGNYDEAITLFYQTGNTAGINSCKYKKAVALIDSGDYEAALSVLEGLYDHISRNKLVETKYIYAMELYKSGQYEKAYEVFKSLNYYKDSPDQAIECGYSYAMELYDSHRYSEAYEIFNSLEYKDSADRAAECLFQKQKAGLKNVTVGSYIRFGVYEQDGKDSNGKEEILWRVLAVKGNKALVISFYAMDRQPYNSIKTKTTWEKCSLRTWLNKTFYNDAFSAYHQKMIISSKVSADKNPKYKTSPGKSTTDKVFLLSVSEAKKYFRGDIDRRCEETGYTGVSYYSWWLRTPGDSSSEAVFVDRQGRICESGSYVSSTYESVRPVMWIKIE